MSFQNILIVDDDPEDAEILCEAVKEVLPLAVCRIAQNAASARELVTQFIPEFIFLDAIMYPVSGKDILREFSQLAQLNKTTFTVMSGVVVAEQRDELIALGATTVVVKPVNYDALLRFVQQIFIPAPVHLRVKLFTNEKLVHNQISSLQDLLEREIEFDISLNLRHLQQNIQFKVTKKELDKIKSVLGYNILFFDGGHWMPNI